MFQLFKNAFNPREVWPTSALNRGKTKHRGHTVVRGSRVCSVPANRTCLFAVTGHKVQARLARSDRYVACFIHTHEDMEWGGVLILGWKCTGWSWKPMSDLILEMYTLFYILWGVVISAIRFTVKAIWDTVMLQQCAHIVRDSLRAAR